MIFGAILAGGMGVRMQGKTAKQFIRLHGKPIIVYTIERMLEVREFDYIYIAIHPSYKECLENILTEFNITDSKIVIIDGGSERIDSVQNVVNATYEINHNEEDIVVIHDAVRPFVSCEILRDCIKAARDFGACIATIPATDTMLVSKDGEFLDEVPDRKTILHGQAPDGFKIGVIKQSIERLTLEEREYITGTAQICHVKGFPIKAIKGDTKNIKITYQQDLILADKILEEEAINAKDS